jgi:hypothetical protein
MAAAKMSVAELEKFLHEEFPQAFSDGDITIESADGETCLLRRRYDDRMLRPGGTVSGPTLMAMADFAMYVVLLSATRQAACGRRGQPAVGVIARSDRPCDSHLFHSKHITFEAVILHHIYNPLFSLGCFTCFGVDDRRAIL